MIAPAVFKNGHPKMIGDLSSVPVLTTMKSAGTYELPTRMQISSLIPTGNRVTDLEAANTWLCVIKDN